MRPRPWPLALLALLIAGCQRVEVATVGTPPGLLVREQLSAGKLGYGVLMGIFGLTMLGISVMPLTVFLRPRGKRDWGSLLAGLAVLGFGGFCMVEVRRQVTVTELLFLPDQRAISCRRLLLGWPRQSWLLPYDQVEQVRLFGARSGATVTLTDLQVTARGTPFCALEASEITPAQAVEIRTGCSRELGSRCR